MNRSNMKRFMSKKLLVVGVAVAVLIGVGGAAFAYFTTHGSGTGSAAVGTSSPLLIDQLAGTPMYNSTIDGSAYQWSMAYDATSINQFGNEITFANGSQPLSDVVVAMSNAGPTTGSIPITFNIYNPASPETSADLLWTDTETVTPPGGTPTGIANFDVTFKNFTSVNYYPGTPLPSTVVYGIAYDNTSGDQSMNVQMSYEPPLVGSDTAPGNLFLSTTGGNGAAGGPTGEVTCSDVNTTFAQYSTASGNSGLCGLGANPVGNLIPAVEFDTSVMSDLYPGGPGQPINFSVTNPSNIPVLLTAVTIAVATDSTLVEATAGYPSTDIAGCYASWFSVSPSPVPVSETIPAGGTIDWVGAATISMATSLADQDACQGHTIGLTFTAS
jgi:hypothetical protein